MACEDFGLLSGLQTLEIIFERDEDEEAYHGEWGDHEGAAKEVVRRMREHTSHVVGVVFSGDFYGEWLQESDGGESNGQVSDSDEELGA